MGAGGRLNTTGPGLFIVYAICGVFGSYAREFLGEKAAYVAGWMYLFNWACTSIVDVTAIALCMHYWGAFEAIPRVLGRADQGRRTRDVPGGCSASGVAGRWTS
jgi:L-asparagine permease